MFIVINSHQRKKSVGYQNEGRNDKQVASYSLY